MDGIGKDAKFYHPTGISLDVLTGTLYVADHVRNKYVPDLISLLDARQLWTLYTASHCWAYLMRQGVLCVTMVELPAIKSESKDLTHKIWR